MESYFANKDFTERGKSLINSVSMKQKNWVIGYHNIDIHNLERLKQTYQKKIIYLVRDPRDCMTSFYFYDIYHKNKIGKRYFRLLRNNLFKKQFITKHLNNWSRHVETYIHFSDHIIRYEDLLTDTFGTIESLFDSVNKEKLKEAIHAFHFEKITERKPGQEEKSAFARKGVQGDWKNHFNDQKTKAIMYPIISDKLIQFNYEKNKNW